MQVFIHIFVMLYLGKQCAVEYGYIAEDYLLYGHRQAGNTECPGNYFFDNALRTLEHWVIKSCHFPTLSKQKYIK